MVQRRSSDEDPKVQTVSLADVRLLTRAKAGEPAAIAEIWQQWRNPLWSVCRAMADDKGGAIELLRALYAELPAAVRGWARDTALCCHVATWVFRRLGAILELPALSSIEAPAPHAVEVPSQEEAARRLARLSPRVRLVYLIDLFFGCPASTTASMLDVSELDLRHARSKAAWSLVAGGAS